MSCGLREGSATVFRRVLIGLVLGAAVLLVPGCAPRASSASKPAPRSEATATAAPAAAATGAAPASSAATRAEVIEGALEMLTRNGVSWSASSEPSKIASDVAIRAVSRSALLETSATVTAVTKVRYSSDGLRHRLVWVVASSPVTLHSHGPAGTNHSPIGQRAIIIDAQTGAELGTWGGNL